MIIISLSSAVNGNPKMLWSASPGCDGSKLFIFSCLFILFNLSNNSLLQYLAELIHILIRTIQRNGCQPDNIWFPPIGDYAVFHQVIKQAPAFSVKENRQL